MRALGAKLNPCDIAQPDNGAVRLRPQDDIAELFRRGQPPLGGDDELQALVIGNGRRPQPTGGGLNILPLDGVDDVLIGQAQIGHQRRVVDPDAHGICGGAEDRRIANPRDAF